MPGCRIPGPHPSPAARPRTGVFASVALVAALILAVAGCGSGREVAAVGRSVPGRSDTDPSRPPTLSAAVDQPSESVVDSLPDPVDPTAATDATAPAPPAPTAPTAPTTPAPTAPAPAPAPTAGPVPPVGPSSLPPCGWRSGTPAAYQHVVWIWMENRHVSEVIGNPNAPYETQLAASCGTGTNFSHAGQPSLPNYIAATSGDTQGIVDNGHPLSHPLTVDNLFRQVRNGGGTARTYAESMPTPCWAGETGEYTYITNPALYYSSLGDAAACLADDVPMGTIGSGALAADIDAGTLPTFANLVPDLCGNSHDCPVAAGDAWLAQWVPRILAGANYRTQATAVFVVWDEFTPMPFIVVSPTTRPGTVVSSSLDHYGLLRTTEEMLGLPFLGRAGSAASMRPGFGL